MGVIAWIILGLLAGFIASRLVNKSGEGLLGDIGLGIVGAVVGGFLASLFGLRGIDNVFDIWSLLIAVGGSVVVLAIYHAIIGRRVPRI